ncbi:MAG: hypothetical protein ACRCT8_18235 [Lacipirellulaceae bacterium]
MLAVLTLVGGRVEGQPRDGDPKDGAAWGDGSGWDRVVPPTGGVIPAPAMIPPPAAMVAGGLEWQILQNPNTPAASVVILDPVRRVLAVYHIDSASGQISLKSVRNLTWDLQLEGFNTKEPQPAEVRDTNRP